MINQEIDSELEITTIPKIHSPVDLRICKECETKDENVPTFDIKCRACFSFLNSEASLNDMFAILRLWTPSVQESIWMIICQMLDSGAHVNDRDGLTDMTMLHYAVKSGAKGIGSISEACRTVSFLLSRGADPYIRCRWTNMAAIHYASFFNVSEVLEILLDATKDVDVDSQCFEFGDGTPLHISCKTLALESVKVLLKHGAKVLMKDSNGLTPADLLPSLDTFQDDPETQMIITKIKTIIQDFLKSNNISGDMFQNQHEEIQSANVLRDLNLKLGDKIFVAGVKTGTLRYCGPTLFANGLWAGIELDEAVGKNDGSIDGIQYFKCPSLYGIFAPLCKVSKQPVIGQNNQINQNRINLTHITAKINSGLKQSKPEINSQNARPAEVGDKVMVSGNKTGVVKFIGDTKFAPGIWYGIDLGRPNGKNDGSVDGFRYFTCSPSHGIFAPPSRIQKLNKSITSRAEKLSMRRNSKQYSSQNGFEGNAKSNPRTKIVNNGAKSSSMSPNTEPILAEGTHVFCNGEIGVVLYVGPVSFAEGIWLGIELRTSKGKHDGAIDGQRYFTCKPGHGLLVRPSKVYVRGINGSKLIVAN